ncbi:MAG: ribonuclease E inhibitor RraB [Flavobacteriaceae bacterium]
MKRFNRRIIQILKVFGDRFYKKREVTQWFYFENLNDLENCEAHLNEIGFKTQYKDKKIRKNFDKLLLIVFCIEPINEDTFNFYFEQFTQIAEKYNGFYDGWETMIENDQQLN